jgi:thioredoxin-dependent peroxiredoxin
MSMPSVGEPAPEIKLAGDDGTIHRLADQRGRWTVVYFYPADDTPGCTTEACQFRDQDDVVRDEGADVWGISPDNLASHRQFRDKFSLNFTLLSDEDHAVAEAYGAWTLKSNYGREYMGIQRSTFLVDPDGRIAHVWPKVKADGHAAEVVEELARGRQRHRAAQS